MTVRMALCVVATRQPPTPATATTPTSAITLTDTAALLESALGGTSDSVGGLPLVLWRYANCTPLLDLHEDAQGCALTTAVRSLPWAQYGYRVRVGTGTNRSSSAAGGGSAIPLLNTPELLLEPTPDRAAALAALGNLPCAASASTRGRRGWTEGETTYSLLVTVDVLAKDGACSKLSCQWHPYQ